MIVKIHEAKTQLSKLIARAEAGEEIVIARDDTPVVKLTPVASARKKAHSRPDEGQMAQPARFVFLRSVARRGIDAMGRQR
jgi:prevent-host-death family protein